MTPPASTAEPSQEAPEQDPRPIVDMPRAGLPGSLIALLAIAAALLLFLVLNGQRQSTPASRANRGQENAFAPAPPLVVPPEPAAAQAPPAVVITTPAPALPPARIDTPPPAQFAPVIVPIQPAPAPPVVLEPVTRTPGRSSEPALVYDRGSEGAQPGGGSGQSRGGNRSGSNTSAGSEPLARAGVIANRTTLMPTGTIIPAVLETPIDTARPGLLRAIVAQDARGFDGRRVLVPRGSRLVGEYQAEVRQNQNRVLVTWTRLIRPDGVTIRLDSPAADPLGGAGVPGRLHTYFFQRFASAILQSALQVGVNIASRPGNGSVIVGLPGTTVNNVVGQATPQSDSLQPKVTVRQGAALNVFVARDLDFSGVPSLP